MDNNPIISEQIVSDRFVITLIDGRELSCVLKSEQPEKIKTCQLELDTTGQYLSIGNKPKNLSESDEYEAERQYNHHIFTENAWFFLDNAERIFSDSRMFFAPVKIQNGLAYVGDSAFRNPTLGTYLEWWLNHKEAAVDANGNLVWYISGSPLSGRNCCSSATPDGKQVDIAQRTKFLDIWTTFSEVNNRYNEAKQRCESYSLEEVLLKLCGEGYKLRIVELKHEMIQEVMGWNYERLSQLYHNVCNELFKLKDSNKKRALRGNLDAIMVFAGGYLEKEKQMKAVHEVYLKKHKELKKQLHDGTLEGHYQTLLAEAAKDYRTAKHELSDMANSFMLKTFGKNNPDEVSFNDVLRFAKARIKSASPKVKRL